MSPRVAVTLSPKIEYAPPQIAFPVESGAPPVKNVASGVHPSGTLLKVPPQPPSKVRLSQLFCLFLSPHQKRRSAYPMTPAHSPSSTSWNKGSPDIPAS